MDLMYRAWLGWIAVGGLCACVGCSSGGGGGGGTLTQLTYTPAGCSYQVSTPDVVEASMSADAVGTTQPTPDHVHVSYAGPTDSTFAVNWHTDVDTKLSYALYGTDQTAVMNADGPGTGVSEQVGHTLVYASGLLGDQRTRVHEVHVCGLSPSTRYYYKVGGPGHWSEVFDVSTGPTIGSTQPWSFAVTGDSRGNTGNAWGIENSQLYMAGVDFELFTGDAVTLGIDQTQWDSWFDASYGVTTVQDVLARVPFMSANGNHEDLAVNYIAQFAFPQQVSPGEMGTGEEWYSFDYANAHFAILNDTVVDNAVLTGSERDWLAADLAAVDRTKTPWVIVSHHRPYYTCPDPGGAGHPPDTALRAAWQPLMDQYHVDMVLNGHNHMYERSKPIRGMDGSGNGVVVTGAANVGSDGQPLVDAMGNLSGTVYVVEGGAGAPFYAASTAGTCNFTYTITGQTHSWAEVQVNDRTLTFTVHDINGGPDLDSFTLTK